MKRIFYNIFIVIVNVIVIVSVNSCAKDDDRVFSENSSTRMTEYLDNAKSVLTSGNATWLMEMYPSSNQLYGGWAFTMRFTNDSVYCSTELAKDVDMEIGSLWRTTRDDGPVLSFDTYNAFVHFFSTPSGTLYQAYNGEFEWVITDVQQDLITLCGKKTGNTIYMRRMTENPQTYLHKVVDTNESMIITGLKGNIGGKDVTASINTDTRQISFTSDSVTYYTTAFCVTPEGIRLYIPQTINGSVITSMTSDYDSTGGITGMTTNNGDKFTAVYPDGYRKYADFIGDYTMYYYLTVPGGYKHVDVSLVAADNGTTFYLTGLNPKYDLVVSYSKSTGSLDLSSQIVLDATTHQPYVSSNGYYIGCAAWAYTAGYVSFATTVGMTGKWNTNNKTQVEIDFNDNGVWQAGYTVNSFKFYYFNDTSMSDGTRVGPVTNTEEYVQGTYKASSIPYLKTMIKK